MRPWDTHVLVGRTVLSPCYGPPKARASAMRTLYGLSVMLLAGVACAGARPTTARATIQEEMCIAPDIEYPVPCDEDDDDGGGSR